MDLFSTDYEDTPEALATIEKTLHREYEGRMRGPRTKALVEQNVVWLQTLYQRNFFPEQDVSWVDYPNHLGHLEFPGCYRCHDGEHIEEGGTPISEDCNLCHDFLDQAEGEMAFEPPVYESRPFQHPRGMTDIWRGRNCSDCHGLEGEGGEVAMPAE